MAGLLDGFPPTLVCEKCLRELPTLRFPSSVRSSWAHHVALPGVDPRKSKWTCKECRAQEVVELEQIWSYRNLRKPEE